MRRISRHTDLLIQLWQRELSQRYRGSALGIAWPFLQPLLLLGVYTLLFGVIFKARWPEIATGGTVDFALVVFAGLVTFQVFSECVGAAPRLIFSNANFVKRVAFPLELLPLVKVAAALTQGLLSLGILVVALVLLGTPPGWSLLWLPLAWLPLMLFALGLSYFLSALGVFLRDIDQVIGVALTALFFGSAIFYPLSLVPEPARRILEWLPTAVFVEDTRRVLLYGQSPLRIESAVIGVLSLGVAVAGYRWFAARREVFADVL